MPKIFISYRRSDSRTISGRIYDRLEAAFGGSEQVFKDVDSIPYGVDFRAHIDDSIRLCDALIVVIGPEWATASDDQGRRRIDDPNDFVRLEIESALRQNKHMYPVLVQGASMPHADELPEGLQPLTYRNAATVRDDPDFHRDMNRLIEDMQAALAMQVQPEPEPAPAAASAGPSRGLITGAAALVVVVVIVIALLFSGVLSGDDDKGDSGDDPGDQSAAQQATPTPEEGAHSTPADGEYPMTARLINPRVDDESGEFVISVIFPEDYYDQIGSYKFEFTPVEGTAQPPVTTLRMSPPPYVEVRFALAQIPYTTFDVRLTVLDAEDNELAHTAPVSFDYVPATPTPTPAPVRVTIDELGFNPIDQILLLSMSFEQEHEITTLEVHVTDNTSGERVLLAEGYVQDGDLIIVELAGGEFEAGAVYDVQVIAWDANGSELARSTVQQFVYELPAALTSTPDESTTRFTNNDQALVVDVDGYRQVVLLDAEFEQLLNPQQICLSNTIVTVYGDVEADPEDSGTPRPYYDIECPTVGGPLRGWVREDNLLGPLDFGLDARVMALGPEGRSFDFLADPDPGADLVTSDCASGDLLWTTNITTVDGQIYYQVACDEVEGWVSPDQVAGPVLYDTDMMVLIYRETEPADEDQEPVYLANAPTAPLLDGADTNVTGECRSGDLASISDRAVADGLFYLVTCSTCITYDKQTCIEYSDSSGWVDQSDLIGPVEFTIGQLVSAREDSVVMMTDEDGSVWTLIPRDVASAATGEFFQGVEIGLDPDVNGRCTQDEPIEVKDVLVGNDPLLGRPNIYYSVECMGYCATTIIDLVNNRYAVSYDRPPPCGGYIYGDSVRGILSARDLVPFEE